MEAATPASPEVAAPPAEPTLPDLLRPAWRRSPGWLRLAVLAALALGVVGVVTYGGSRLSAVHTYRYEGPAAPSFTFRYGDRVRMLEPHGREIVRLESSAGGVLSQRMVITPLGFDVDRRGTVGARLPLDAVAYARRAAARYRSFRTIFEGRTRLNGIESYQIVFQARYRPRASGERQLFGKIVLMPEVTDRPRRGIAVEMLATTISPIRYAATVGNRGVLKKPFRSLRYL